MKRLLILLLIICTSTIGIGVAQENNGSKPIDKIKNPEPQEDTKDANIPVYFGSYWANLDYDSLLINEVTTFSTALQTMVNIINASNVRGNFIYHPDMLVNVSYYQQLDTILANPQQDPPLDFFMLTSDTLAKYYAQGYLEEFYYKDLQRHNIDTSDWHDGIISLGTVNTHLYGIPLGHDKLVWYVNLELFEQAGLLHEDGSPILPNSIEELGEYAKQMKEKTNISYLGVDFLGTNGMKAFMSLIWQLGEDIVVKEGNNKIITLDTLGKRLIAEDLLLLFNEELLVKGNGFFTLLNSFINGKLAVLIEKESLQPIIAKSVQANFIKNVNAKKKELAEYEESQAEEQDEAQEPIIIPVAKPLVSVELFPPIYGKTSIVWGNTNLIVMRKGIRTQNFQKYESILEFIARINLYDIVWKQQGLESNKYSSIETSMDLDDETDFFSFSSKKKTPISQIDGAENDEDIELSHILVQKGYTIKEQRSFSLREVTIEPNYPAIEAIMKQLTTDLFINQDPIKDTLSQAEARLIDLVLKKGYTVIR